MSEPITVTVREFCRLSGLGKTTVFKMVGDGRLERIRVGHRTLIVMASYRRLIPTAAVRTRPQQAASIGWDEG